MSDEQLAEISEQVARYFMGWKPKPPGKRRFPLFEERVRKIVEGTTQVSPDEDR